MPIANRTMPPAISILFSNKCPDLSPMKTPRKDSAKVMVPMIIIGVAIAICRNAKLTPTASASMLVAIESSNSTWKFSGLVSLWADSIRVDS